MSIELSYRHGCGKIKLKNIRKNTIESEEKKFLRFFLVPLLSSNRFIFSNCSLKNRFFRRATPLQAMLFSIEGKFIRGEKSITMHVKVHTKLVQNWADSLCGGRGKVSIDNRLLNSRWACRRENWIFRDFHAICAAVACGMIEFCRFYLIGFCCEKVFHTATLSSQIGLFATTKIIPKDVMEICNVLVPHRLFFDSAEMTKFGKINFK